MYFIVDVAATLRRGKFEVLPAYQAYRQYS